jgi:hypothetical protein
MEKRTLLSDYKKITDSLPALPCKCLRQFTQTIEWIEVRRFAILTKGCLVQLDILERFKVRLGQITARGTNENRLKY